MNALNEKIKQGYDNTELPEELRLRVRREFLLAAETKREGGITMSRKIKKPAAIAIIAAATLTVGITAGAAVNGIFHKESIDIHLGEGAADMVAESVEIKSVTTENEYLRITADAVFSDGNTVMIYLTKERLTDPYLGWRYDSQYDIWTDMIFINAEYEDGTRIDEQCGYTNVTEVRDESGWRVFVEPSEDGVAYEVCELDNIEAGRPIVLTFHDRTYDGDSNIAEGLSLTIDSTQNFTPVTFADEKGRELNLTPYRIDTCDPYYGNYVWLAKLTLKNSETGEQRSFGLKNGHSTGEVTDPEFYSSYNYNELIPDIEQYDILEVKDINGISYTLYRQ